MPELELFQAALGLTLPRWLGLRRGRRYANHRRRFSARHRFVCPTCGRAECPAYDVEPKRWRHLNF
jgi:hypothetical protein